MPTTISKTSINYVSRLIRDEFDALSPTDKLIGLDQRLIQTAREFQLITLADEMQNDL